jgi:hypothetical protein
MVQSGSQKSAVSADDLKAVRETDSTVIRRTSRNSHSRPVDRRATLFLPPFTLLTTVILASVLVAVNSWDRIRGGRTHEYVGVALMWLVPDRRVERHVSTVPRKPTG